MGVDTPDKKTLQPAVRWRNSLLARVALLCVVLVLCLLGSVISITLFYFHEVVQDMEARTNAIVDNVRLEFEEKPDVDFGALENQLRDAKGGLDIQLQPYTGQMGAATYTREHLEDGSIMRVARVPIRYRDREVLLTARVRVTPYSEVAHAFRNKYMLALSFVFLLTLSLLVYFIARTLRPLRELSQSCAAIASGELRAVSTAGATGEIRALEETFNTMVESLRGKEMVEAKLRQAQRLSALGNLAAGIAHDVRNPLNAIKLLSSHALDMIPEETDSPAVKPLRTIRNEVDRLENIVSNFLALAKERQLTPEPQAVDDLLGECARLLQKDAETRGIHLACDLRAGNRVLMLDPKQFTRAVLNVLLNSLEACGPGGRVRLSSRLSDRACQIEIQDDGPGLPQDVFERVFEPYYTTKAGGTGLGLSITRGIVEEHGGRIEIYSVSGHGCQVLITMPLA